MLRWVLLVLVVLGIGIYVERDQVAPYAPKPIAAFLKQGNGDAGQGGQGRGRNAGGARAVTVTVAEAKSGSLPVLRETIGSILPVASTTMSSETTGIVASVAVSDGARVKTGDLLVSLDSRSAKATVAKDQAAIDRDQISLDEANRVLTRTQTLVKSGAYTTQQGDDALATVKLAQAALTVDRAALAADQVTLAKMEIRAPYDGRLGAFQVSTGALVTPGTSIVVLSQETPVYAAFTLPEGDLDLVQNSLASSVLGVTLHPSSGSAPADGKVVFIDNAVNAQSGTIGLRALVDNKSAALVPGQSISATVKAGERADLVIVPSVAVEPRDDGAVVYLVKPDDTVEIRKVDVALRVGDEAGIASGLQAGDRVVTEGQGGLTAGAKIRIEGAPPKEPTDGTPVASAKDSAS